MPPEIHERTNDCGQMLAGSIEKPITPLRAQETLRPRSVGVCRTTHAIGFDSVLLFGSGSAR